MKGGELYGSWTFSYAPNGEVTSQTNTSTGAITTYGYDTAGNLRSVVLPDGRKVEYVLDARNRRIGKKINGVLVQGWLYRDSLSPVAELDGSGAIVSRFVYVTGGRVPSYMTKNGVTYRIVADERGTPTQVVDVATGSVAQSIDVDEFGVVLSDTSPGFQTLGFAGGLYDLDTGLVHFGARDYNAAVGRWMSKDPARLTFGANVYSYAANEPVGQIDPTGLAPGDRWYGFNNGNFQNWVHRQMKDDGQSDFTKDEIEDLWNEWNAQGRPGGDKSNKPKRGGRRQCEQSPDNYSDPDYPSPDQSVEPSDDSDPEPDPNNGPTQNEFQGKPFDGPGPWYEDGSPVNPIPPDWSPPILPGLMSPTVPTVPPLAPAGAGALSGAAGL